VSQRAFTLIYLEISANSGFVPIWRKEPLLSKNRVNY
jgi:hypothetical protein